MLPLIDPEGVRITRMIVTSDAFEVWHIHMLTLDVGPQNLCRAKTLLTNRANFIAQSHPGKYTNGRASLILITGINSQPRQDID